MKSVELFTGAGGLALGLSVAGFQHLALVERDEHSCETLRENQRRNVADMSSWQVAEQDIEQFDFASIPEGIELLAAGVPCQPFSIGESIGVTKTTGTCFLKRWRLCTGLNRKPC